MVGKRLYIFIAAQTAILLLCLVGITILMVRQSNQERETREQLVAEIRANSEAIESVRSGLLRVVEDTGEVRDSLMLPRRDYSFLDASEGEEGASTEPSPFAAYFSALKELVEYNRNNASYEEVRAFLENAEVLAFISQEGLRPESGENGRYRILWNGELLARLEGSEEAGSFTLLMPEGEQVLISEPTELTTLLQEEISRRRELASRVEEAWVTLRDVIRDADVQELLRERELYAGRLSATERSVRLPIFKGRNEEVLSLRWEAGNDGYAVGEMSSLAPGELLDTFKRQLQEGDLRSDRERMVDARAAELEELFADPGFEAYLDSLGLSISREPREGEEYLYFDLQNVENGAPAGSLAIQRLNGTVWVMDEDDVPLSSLRRIQSGGADRTSSRDLDQPIPEVTGLLSREGEETFLMIGSHERMADTVILAHVDHERETIQLISVPRDLYYRGRKLNVLYPNYGGERFASEISEITGLRVTGYVAIDMYAFIDVVNILGGVEVTLGEPLIDPTYRTKVNGRWSTLYYPAGTHLLSGLEALRLARSRHTSSDFERAERQQQILSSLKNKLGNLGAQNMGTLYELVSTLLHYVESDLSSYELARLLTQARSYAVTSQVVLNTDNILYHTYSNLYYSGKSADEVDEDFYKGAWILLPKEDDWNAIRWYIREVLNEEAA